MLRVFLVIDDYNELIYLQTLLKKLGFDVEGLQNTKKYADLSLGFNPHILITTARGKKVDGLALARSIHKRRDLPKVIALKLADQVYEEDEFLLAGVDQTLDSPINPKKLILAIASLGDLDENLLLEKYSKVKGLVAPPGAETQTILSFDENGQPVEEIHHVKSAIESLKTGTAMFPLQKEPEESIKVSAASPAAAVDKVVSDRPREVIIRPEPDAKLSVERQARFDKWTKEIGKLPPSYFNRERILAFNKKIRAAEPPEDIDEIESERKKFVKSLFKK